MDSIQCFLDAHVDFLEEFIKNPPEQESARGYNAVFILLQYHLVHNKPRHSKLWLREAYISLQGRDYGDVYVLLLQYSECSGCLSLVLSGPFFMLLMNAVKY